MGDNGKGSRRFQNSNIIGSVPELRNGAVSSKGIFHSRSSRGDSVLYDFIKAQAGLIDKEVFDRFEKGEAQAITDSLNQIHWRSLKRNQHPTILDQSEDGTKKKSYSEVLKNSRSTNDGWIQVEPKKRSSSILNGKRNKDTTIFLANIPVNAKAVDIWSFFNNCGEVKDIILPKKRDKNN